MARMWIGGEWQDGAAGETYEVINPATGAVVDTAVRGNAEDVQRAVEAAAAALGPMAESTAEQRGLWLEKMVELVRAQKQDLAETLTKEQGKPVGEAAIEIEHFLHGMHFYAGLASKYRGSFVPLPAANTYGIVMKQPIGVCAGIVPWNFPITLMGTKVGPAIAAGNTIIVKPASSTPLTALKIVALLSEAGVPKGAINCITGPGSVVGEALVQHPLVKRIAFTGESGTGRHIGEVCGRMLKRVTLELGGSDPMIVCDDGDLDKAASLASVGRYYNNGQMCLGVKRLFVFDSVFDAFMDKLVPRIKRLVPGDPLNPKTRTGAMHNRHQRDEIAAQVEDALAQGAKALVGGQKLAGGDYDRGNWFAPTLLTDVAEDARIVKEESFGPALPVFRVNDLDEALEKANASEYGLGAFLSPVLVAYAIASGAGFRAAYWLIALALVPCALWLVRLPSPAARPTTQANSHRGSYGVLAVIVLFFFLYAGSEAGFGGWIYTYALKMRLGDASVAALLTSTFWGALTLGRLLAIPVAARMRASAILVVDLVAAMLCAGLLLAGSGSLFTSWLGTFGLGLALASVFPTMLAFAERQLAITGKITGWFFVGGSAGGLTIPWLMGQFFEPAGPQSLMLILLVDLLLTLLALLLLAFRARRA